MAFLLQEDDASFEAALSFLDEFDSHPQEAKHDGNKVNRRKLTAEEKTKRKAEFNEKRKLLRKAGVYGDANRARNERAQEIAQLRGQAEKLQIDLQLLQTRRADKSSELRQENTNELASKDPTSGMWRGLAEQQRRRREEAERDNVLLRLAVERQRKVANNLQMHMHRRATQLTNECASLITTARSNDDTFSVLDLCGDMESFRGLFQRLDDAYHRMDSVLLVNGLADLSIAPADVHVHERGDGECIEFVSYKVLPFDVRTTAEATWKHFKGIEKHLANGSLYEKAEKGLEEPYTIIADYKKETFSSSSRADIHVKQVIRRYVEEDRDIVIWVCRAVPIEIKHKLLQGLTYHLQGYAVTKRSAESTPDREMAVLQLCYFVSLDADVRCSATNLRDLITFLVTTVARNIQAHRERIENALIDREVRGDV
ncbi:hypothetical protein PHMEG_00026948 [Phytophthora megakarya]|uniref:M96 mating-specific protein n=1 Tax=Phytophthora megakarya TaxID=4795 RepID=A0A225VA27_9STRA|nr:hypothetical protein PHMEG_00026948 [Phytophthora megakarya]